MLVTPAQKAKKSLDFLNNFNFTTTTFKILAKYGWLMLGTFDLTNCFYLVTVIWTFITASCFFGVFLWYFYQQYHFLYMVKVFILLIPWFKVWYIHFACTVIVSANHDGSKSSQNKLDRWSGQHNHTMIFFTHFDFESVLSSSTHSWQANIYYC